MKDFAQELAERSADDAIGDCPYTAEYAREAFRQGFIDGFIDGGSDTAWAIHQMRLRGKSERWETAYWKGNRLGREASPRGEQRDAG